MTTERDVILEDLETIRTLIDCGGSREQERAALHCLDRVTFELGKAQGTADRYKVALEQIAGAGTGEPPDWAAHVASEALDGGA